MKWSILSVTCLFPESLCYAACCMGEGRRDTWNFVLLNYFFSHFDNVTPFVDAVVGTVR